jgi:hypothetical protein
MKVYRVVLTEEQVEWIQQRIEELSVSAYKEDEKLIVTLWKTLNDLEEVV